VPFCGLASLRRKAHVGLNCPGRGEPPQRPAVHRPALPGGQGAVGYEPATHFLTAQTTPALVRGAFAEDQPTVARFVEEVVEELAPRGAREHAEPLAIAGLYVRRARLQELEALALAGTTRAQLLPGVERGPPRITESEQERAADRALSSDLLERLPRYEAHLSQELDRCTARLRRMQQERLDGLLLSG